MRSIALILQRLQEAELPLEKLDLLMAAVSMIFNSTGCPKGQPLNADDFLPLLVFVVARTGFVGAEIEAEFMWGLLQPSLLSGEAGYYLTALCSAVHVLKTFKESQTEGTGTIDVSIKGNILYKITDNNHLPSIAVALLVNARLFLSAACHHSRRVQWLAADPNAARAPSYDDKGSVSHNRAQGSYYEPAGLWTVPVGRRRR